jgi:hypothetical protein
MSRVRSTTNYEGYGIESQGEDGADVEDDEDGAVYVMEILPPTPRRSRW